MTLQMTIDSTIDQTARDLASAAQFIPRKLEEQSAGAAEELRQIMQRESHVKTGRMRAAERVQGPFRVGVGTIEYRIGPFGVSYAKDEMARGGDHDFVQRTIDAADAVLDRLARSYEQTIVAEIE